MRIHRIKLTNFRGVDSAEVAFDGQGVTVIEGDNEVGKSSIFEALDLIFLELDSSSKARIRSVQPAGKDVGPEAEVEVSSGDYRFVYHKRWRRRPETTLTVKSPRHESLTGREAHARVREMLDETIDWPLWEALRVQQGTELRLPSLDVRSLGAALDQAAGGDGPTGGDDALWDRIEAERGRYWTGTGRVSKERTELEGKVRSAQDRVAELKEALSQIQTGADKFDSLVEHQRHLESEHQTAQERESELSDRWRHVEQLELQAGERDTTHRAALSDRGQRHADAARRAELVSDLDCQNEALAAIGVKLEESAPALNAADQLANDAEGSRDEAREALDQAIAAHKQACDDRDHHRRMIEVAQFRERLERIDDAQARLASAEPVLENIRVDGDLVERIDQAHIVVVRAEASAEIAAAQVTTTALRDVTLQVDGMGHDLAAGQQLAISVSDAAELKIDDSATVLVQAGKGPAETARELHDARRELQRLCDECDVPDLASARAANDRRESALRDRDDARKTIKDNQRDLTADELKRMADRHSQRIEEFNASRESQPPLPADFREATALVTKHETAVGDRRAEFESCEEAAKSTNAALTQAQLDAAVLASKLQSAQEGRDQAAERLTAARLQVSDEDLATALAHADEAVAETEQAARAVQTRLQEADPDSIKAQLTNARDAVGRMAGELTENSRLQHELRGSLEARGEMGLHTQHDNAMNEMRSLERDHESLERRALAAELLYETFGKRRQEARQRYVAPFKERIEQFGRIVFDSTFEVELDEQLGIARRTLNGITLDVEQLSTGTREQLGILARLACAAIVSPDGNGAPVVIDDALGWSDPTRLQRMGAAIAAAGKHCQVIVLTCTPGRYAHVGNATVLNLPD